jgi:translation initiation factor IF-2
LADKEEIDIRYYSIIYAAIDDLKDAMEGMLARNEGRSVGTAEIREIFKISKVGSGCMVMDGKIARNAKQNYQRGVVVHEGELLISETFQR